MEVEHPSSGSDVYHLRYNRRDLLTQEQRDLALVRFRVMQDQAMATELGVTEDQVAELKKIPTGAIEMEVSDADRSKLIELFKEWQTGSDKSSAEKALVAQLGAVGSSSFENTKAKVAERAAKIMTILKPEQIKKFNEMSNK
jgi:Spy/CpxP family protein refolding chaperone